MKKRIFLQPMDRQEINHAGLVIHHAAQFPAMAGKYLVKQEPDDSNTNLQWIDEKNIFAGNPIRDGIKTGLDPVRMELLILDQNNQVIAHLNLRTQSFHESFEWMKRELAELGVDVSPLKDQLHYTIPPLNENNTHPFKAGDDYLNEWVMYRSVANQVLESLAGRYSTASNVRVWPHHFDTGTYIPLEFNDNKEAMNSIGLGFAVADSYVPEPYFYINHWAKEENIDYSNLPGLDGSGRWNQKDWVGAVLPVSSLTAKSGEEEQNTTIDAFFNSGIHQTLKLLNLPESFSV